MDYGPDFQCVKKIDVNGVQMCYYSMMIMQMSWTQWLQ